MPRTHAFQVIVSLALAGIGSAQSAIIRVSVGTGGLQGNNDAHSPTLSANGRIVVFTSLSDNLVAGDTNNTFDMFAHDRQTGVTQCVSVDPNGVPGNGGTLAPSSQCLSDDGRYVLFADDSSNLVANDTNNDFDIFVRDLQLGVTELESVSSSGVQQNSRATSCSMSGDARYVAFASFSNNLVIGDTNNAYDTFVHDRQTGATTRVSFGPGSVQGNSDSYPSGISADGRFVVISSWASNLVIGDTNSTRDIFVHDRQTAQTTRVSVDSSGLQGNGASLFATITPDGRYVEFQSQASNLVAGDTNGKYDAFVHDRLTGQTTRVSVDSPGNQGDGDSTYGRMSADGRYAVFSSIATNLVTGDTNGVGDIFVRDRLAGTTVRISLDAAGAQANGASDGGFISHDAQWVGFYSAATSLVAGDTNGVDDAFLRTFALSCAAISYCTSGTTTNGCNATMSATGTPSASATSGFTLGVADLEGQKTGLIFYGVNGRLANAWAPGSSSFVCVKSPVQRTSSQTSGGTTGACDGALSLDWNQYISSNPGALGTPLFVGQLVDAQAWFRDPPASKTTNLSDALEFSVCP